MAAAYGGMSPGTGPKKKKDEDRPSGSGSGPGFRGGLRVGKGGRNPKPAAAPKPPAKPTSSPVSQRARDVAAKAQKSADRYAQVQRAANKAKRAVLSRKGPQDLAGRVQRDMDLKRMRELQKGAESWKKKAKGQGIRFGGDKPSGSRPAASRSGGTTPRSTGGAGGGASAASSVARATSGGGAAKPSSAPKVGRVLKNARAQREQTTGVPITAKELAAFMKRYDATHTGTLSRSDAVLMARLIKQRGGKLAKSYGLNVAQEN